MTMATLLENTVVVHPKTGEPTLLAATGELPDWAQGLVGDHLLDGSAQRQPTADSSGGSVQGAGGSNDGLVEALRARIADLEASQRSPSSREVAEAPSDAPAVPPRGGPGSGAHAWREYAARVSVGVPTDASREEVIEALEVAGKPTE